MKVDGLPNSLRVGSIGLAIALEKCLKEIKTEVFFGAKIVASV
jgi:hypothetical protein